MTKYPLILANTLTSGSLLDTLLTLPITLPDKVHESSNLSPDP